MKKILLLALVATLILGSCSQRMWPKAVKHGGPCPQNAGMIGYSNY
jgi:PBP1b-binding outer membrane lipoprotein LpoB